MKLNCMIVDDDEMSRKVLINHIQKTEYIELAHTCTSAIEANNILKADQDVDIIFLDIEMPEMNGIEFLKNLPNHADYHVILTTGKEAYALEAFEYFVVDYLVKPIQYSRFVKAVDKVIKLMGENAGKADHEFLFVRSNHKIFKIPPKDIEYIEALSDYILIHTIDKKYVVHATMRSIEEKLKPFKIFARIHRSYIVNLERMESIQELSLFIGGKTIPIGRSYKPEFLDKLDIL